MEKPRTPEKTNIKLSKDFGKKNTAADRNFEIRKMAEERATKRFKSVKEDILQPKKSTLGKEKSFTSKREYKLPLSKAKDDAAFDGKERSLSSVKRARLKAK